MKLNLALAAALSLTNNNNIVVSAELAAEEIEELNTLFAEEIHLEEQNEEILEELSSLSQTRFDVGGGEEEEEGEMVAQSDTLEGGDEEGGDIVLNFDAPDLRVEDEEFFDELPEEDGVVPIMVSEEATYTTSAMEEEEEEVHVPTKHELHHAAKIAAKANKHHDMLSKAHSMKSVEKKHSKAAKAVHGSKGSKRGKMGKAHLSMPTHSGKANKMPIHHEAKTQKAPSTATVKSTSQSALSSKANKATTDSSTEAMPVPMPVEETETSGDDDVTELNMEPVPRTPDVSPAHHTGVDTSELNGRLKQEMAEVMLGDTSHVGKGHSQSNENVAALDLLRAKSDAAAQSNGGVVGRSVGIVGGVCLVGSILYGMM